MKKFSILFLLFLSLTGKAQHTFSIVAVDSITGEIGSAGATCGDSIIWPGTPGAKIISDIIPGKGAIHTQAQYITPNQVNARKRMVAGDNPKQIIDWLIINDDQGDPTVRQYGIVDFNNGHPRSAGYTGTDCLDHKNHLLGKNYAIQGNILMGQQVLDSMELRFKKTKGSLAEKLMAAMQGAKMVGADSRCSSNGTSSLSAFLRMAKPTDNPNAIYLDLNIAGTAPGVEPIDKLREKYDNWKIKAGVKDLTNIIEPVPGIFPNPAENSIHIKVNNSKADKIEIIESTGRQIYSETIDSPHVEIDITPLASGIYFVKLFRGELILETMRFLKK